MCGRSSRLLVQAIMAEVGARCCRRRLADASTSARVLLRTRAHPARQTGNSLRIANKRVPARTHLAEGAGGARRGGVAANDELPQPVGVVARGSAARLGQHELVKDGEERLLKGGRKREGERGG